MTRAERKAIQARVAVRVLAQLAAKNAVKHQIRAQGLRLHDFAAKDIRISRSGTNFHRRRLLFRKRCVGVREPVA